MTESRLRTVLLGLIFAAVAGIFSYQLGFFEPRPPSIEELRAEREAKVRKLRVQMGKTAVPRENAYKPGDPIPQAIKNYARTKGIGMGYDKICGQYNYNDAGIKQHEANISDILQDFDRIQLNTIANREAKKFIGMNKRLTLEEREAKCAEGWKLYGPNGTAIPDYLLE